MDVYKLENAIVQSENQSDGWLLEMKITGLYVAGDVKI